MKRENRPTTDKPNSPIVKDQQLKAAAKKQGAAGCVYNGKTFKDGETTCIAPYIYVCHDGLWVYTGTGCGGTAENE
jgi:hypothetical protein